MFVENTKRVIQRLVLQKEAGQTLIEYGLIIGLIAIAAIAGVGLVANDVASLWGGIADRVGTAIADVLSG